MMNIEIRCQNCHKKTNILMPVGAQLCSHCGKKVFFQIDTNSGASQAGIKSMFIAPGECTWSPENAKSAMNRAPEVFNRKRLLKKLKEYEQTENYEMCAKTRDMINMIDSNKQ